MALPKVSDLVVGTAKRFVDPRGALSVLDWLDEAPFDIVRIFWLSEVPAGTGRGGHGHRRCQQFLICLTGRIEFDAFDGEARRHIDLAAGQTFHLPVGIFIDFVFRTEGSLLLTLCDQPFEVEEYIDSEADLIAFRAMSEK